MQKMSSVMNRQQQVMDIATRNGIINARDVESAGISRNYLYSLQKNGLLKKIEHGIYMPKTIQISENFDFLEVAKRVPKAVFCLISALVFHQLTTEIQHEIWIALPKGSWIPKIHYPPINISFVSLSPYTYGIEEHKINDAAIRIYSPAKTVADCFKFRSKVGLDVAIEGLKEALRTKKATPDEIMRAAKVNRVTKIIQPYLEALI